MKQQKTKFLKYLLLFGLVSIVILSGCEQTKETVEEVADKAIETTSEVVSEAADKVSETAENALEKVTEEVETLVEDKFLIGTWGGKFDSRKTVLVITSQEDNNVEGKISISYRQAINQEVKGKFDPENGTLTLNDQLHSRFKGTYEGKLSDDRTGYSGTFTVKVDGKNYNFNLNKK